MINLNRNNLPYAYSTTGSGQCRSLLQQCLYFMESMLLGMRFVSYIIHNERYSIVHCTQDNRKSNSMLLEMTFVSYCNMEEHQAVIMCYLPVNQRLCHIYPLPNHYVLFTIQTQRLCHISSLNQIENPFGTEENDLPMESFCQEIANDLHEIFPTTYV